MQCRTTSLPSPSLLLGFCSRQLIKKLLDNNFDLLPFIVFNQLISTFRPGTASKHRRDFPCFRCKSSESYNALWLTFKKESRLRGKVNRSSRVIAMSQLSTSEETSGGGGGANCSSSGYESTLSGCSMIRRDPYLLQHRAALVASPETVAAFLAEAQALSLDLSKLRVGWSAASGIGSASAIDCGTATRHQLLQPLLARLELLHVEQRHLQRVCVVTIEDLNSSSRIDLVCASSQKRVNA